MKKVGINGNGDDGKQSALGNYSANGARAEALDIVADGSHISDGLLDHSVSKHLVGPGRRFITLPLSATNFRSFPVEASPLVGRLADLPGRIEFVILRTDRSPPAAPHPASRRRSCIRLQAGERMPGEDFHLSDQMRSQAHQPSLPRLEMDTLSVPALKTCHYPNFCTKLTLNLRSKAKQ